MLIRSEIKTIRDLVKVAGYKHKNCDFLRFVEDGKVTSITYEGFASYCNPIMAWVADQSNILGHPIRVAMMSSNNPLFVLMMMGIMAGGGVAIPMDPQMPLGTVCNCLNKAEADFLIYEPGLAVDEYQVTENCPYLNEILTMAKGDYPCCSSIIDLYAGRVETIEVSADDCALIIFTSGTTGEEKGVMLSNGNLVDNVLSTSHVEGSVKLNILPMHHAFCITADLTSSFVAKGVLCMNGDTSKLGENLQLFKPTLLTMVPVVAQALYNKLLLVSKQTGKTPYELKNAVFGPNVKKIVAGGAHLPAELVEKYQELGIYLCQGYGMSECSPVISSPDYTRPDKAHTAGRVIEGCRTRVVEGELQVKSPSVMMGYVNAPELTAEVITEDGWLKTGDIGYEDEEGFLHITGRKKNLIILGNGANVSPEQIENFLLDYQIIQEALVYGEGNTIVAEVYPDSKYIALNGISDVKGTIEKVIADVNAPQPSYKKIMKLVIRTKPFERTGSNKIKRNQRANPDEILSADAPKLTKPQNELQNKFYKIFADIFNHDNFGVDTDLFTVGLDSLGCVMALTAFSETLDFYAEFDDIMKNNTIEKLEKFYNDKASETNIDFSPRPVYPLTRLQMYFAYVIKGNTTANLPNLFKLDESVSLERMQESLDKLLKLHPILTDVIQMFEDKGYANFRNDNREVNFPIETLSKEEWEVKKTQLIRPYMYTQGEPLYHIEMYNVEGEKYLFFDIAHIIADGVSLGILFEDLNKLYCDIPVKSQRFNFYDYILDDQYRRENGLNNPNMEYFTKLMSGMKIKRTILNRKGHQELSVGENAVIRSRFNQVDCKKLKDYCSAHGVSENAIFLTAFNQCISIFSDKDDTVSTSIHSGRTDNRWANITGCLFTTYNFRCKFNKKESVEATISKSAKQIMDTMCCKLNNLHADEMFIQYQGTILNFKELGGAPVKREHLQLDSLPFHLMIFSNEETYSYELRYWNNRFEEKQLQIFMDCMDAVLKAMVEKDMLSSVRNELPRHIFANDVTISSDELNIEAGCEITAGGRDVKVKIIDRNGYEQPIGGWGILCINNIPTNRTARIMTDRTVDFIENSGRNVMVENLSGRSFPDLEQIENVVKDFDGVNSAEAYICYGADNQLCLTADIDGTVEREKLLEYMKEKLDAKSIPTLVKINGKTE